MASGGSIIPGNKTKTQIILQRMKDIQVFLTVGIKRVWEGTQI